MRHTLAIIAVIALATAGILWKIEDLIQVVEYPVCAECRHSLILEDGSYWKENP